jgi:hypothetical protein
MRSLLTGYAGVFNRRHRRAGHLFQNRYRSVVVEEEPYFLELVRYLHLNPIRAGLVSDLSGLDRYPYCGHAALMGSAVRPWQDTETVLQRFAGRPRVARERYRVFVAEGLGQGRRPELVGGGLVRSAGGRDAVRELHRAREIHAADERILGGSEFVTGVLRQAARTGVRALRGRWRNLDAVALLRKVCQAERLPVEGLLGGGRRPAVCRVREGIAYLWVEHLGRSGRQLSAALGIRPESVYRAARRGAEDQERWRRILAGR